MKLTILQLQQSTEEQFLAMSVQIQRTQRNYDELYARMDQELIEEENFLKEMKMNFSEMRRDLSEMRRDISAMRGENSEMRGEISGLRSDMRAEFAALNQNINNRFT